MMVKSDEVESKKTYHFFFVLLITTLLIKKEAYKGSWARSKLLCDFYYVSLQKIMYNYTNVIV